MADIVLQGLITLFMCKNFNMELVLDQFQLRPQSERRGPPPPSKAGPHKQGLGRRWSRIILRTLTWPRRWERSCWFDGGFLWRHCQCAGSPFSETHTHWRCGMLPSTVSQVRGVSALRASCMSSAFWGTQWTSTWSTPEESKSKTSEWGGLAGCGLHCLSCWNKSACFLWAGGGVCLQQSWYEVTACSTKLHRGAHVTQERPRGLSRRPWQKEAKCTLGVLLSESQTEGS